MTKDTILALDSYRLAQYAVPVPCYVCGSDNTCNSELCHTCFAPMALAHQANSQKIFPRMVATIGPSGVGKTVYLGVLMDMLSRQSDQLQLMARGAFSINLQLNTVSALSKCRFPAKTPNEPDRWNWVHCQARMANQRRSADLIMPDMAGEAILEEIDHPNTYPVIRSFLSKCKGAMILVDARELQGGNRDQDYFTMKLLTYLIEMDRHPKTGWGTRPISLILSKADECEECFDDPTVYAKSHASGLWQFCQEKFKDHKFFAAGVAGACAFQDNGRSGIERVPLRTELRGIVEPFEWLVSRLPQ